MRSRVGLKPNGTLLLKKPQDHFEVQDFVKALDKWSKSIPDNPVSDFTAKIAIKQIHTFPIYHLASFRKYENRGLSQETERGNPFKYNQVPQRQWSQVNAWDYNLDEQEKDHHVVLNDTIYATQCQTCNATGEVVVGCRSCGGAGRVQEEEYRNGNTYTVTKGCSPCGGSGRQKDTCNPCNGHGGFVHYMLCHVEYTRPNHNSFYTHDKIKEVKELLDISSSDFSYFNEVQTSKDFVSFVAGDIKEKSISQLVSFIGSNDSNNQHFLREKTSYGQTYLTLIHFRYEEGGEYTLVLYGENGKVFAPDSPISNCVDGLLAEAEQSLHNKDIESAKKIISQVYSMRQKMDVANDFVKSFVFQVATSLEKMSYDKKTPVLKQIEYRKTAAINGVNIAPNKLFDLSTEIISFLMIPFIVSLAFKISSYDFSQISKSRALEDIGLTFLFSAVFFGLQYSLNRKEDLYFKSLWKYLASGVALALPIIAISQASSVISYLIYGAISFGLFKLINSLMTRGDDTGKLFKLNGHKDAIENVMVTFEKEMNKIKELLPENHSYINKEVQSSYIQQARRLEELSNEFTQDENISYFFNEKKIA